MPACDTCRTRKIRCDQQSPCGACRNSSFECTTNSRRARAVRKTGSASRQFTTPLSVIQPKLSNQAKNAQDLTERSSSSVHTPKSVSTDSQRPSYLSGLPVVSLVDSDSVEFEGESSLHAHSVAARDLLAQTLDSDSQAQHNPRLIAALSSLRRIVEVDKTESSQKKPKLVGLGGPRRLIYELKLPPTDLVLDVLRQSKERTTFVFSSSLAYISRDQFNKLCQTVFFRTEDYPTSTAIIVHGTLENLLSEFTYPEGDAELRQQYSQWAALCRTNLEISISNLDLLLPVTQESAQALVFAALYCMEIGQASICKKLVTHGCMMVQSLGWHHSSSLRDDSDDVQRQKLLIFWTLYLVDQHLSLRLGHASLIQDHDIDLPLPWIEASAPHASMGRLNLWVKQARVMGLVYQRLYSPGALKQNSNARFQAVQQLLQELESIKAQTFRKDDISGLIRDLQFVPAPYLYDANEMILKSDEVMYYALLCMIHRATPTSEATPYDPVIECINSARAALDCHKSCTTALKDQSELWAAYLHWTILNTPFVPFTTLFSHVLTSHNRADLERLQDFANSMSDCPTSQPAQKVSRLASVFVSVATIYIESREQETTGNLRAEPPEIPHSDTQAGDVGPDPEQQRRAYPTPAWLPFDPFIDALGFVEDPSLSANGGSGTNINLENWFNGNQHIMGLLEDDLSNLDPMFLNF